MRKSILITILIIFIIILAVFVWKHGGLVSVLKTVKLKMPSGKIVQVPVRPAVDEKTKKKMINAIIEGKIEEVPISNIPDDPVTRIVMIANSGEMLILLGPGQVNKLRFGDYIGRIVKLKGYWYGELPFRGRTYRALWVEKIIE